MKNIIVIAYLIHHSKGSEFAVAWDYITHMSKSNKLTVLYGSCDGFHKIGNTIEMEDYLANNPLQNVRFIPVKPSFMCMNYDYSVWGIHRFYKEYELWHRDVRAAVLDLLEHNNYDLIHYLGPIGYREPGFLYGLNIPYIWGPIGGMAFTDFRIFKGANEIKGGLQLLIKKIFNEIQLRFSPRVKDAMSKADLVIGCTKRTTQIIKKIYNVPNTRLLYFTQNCLQNEYPLEYEKFERDIIDVVWVGRIDAGKSLITALRALAGCKYKDKYRLHVIGLKGSQYNKCVEYIKNNSISELVQFYGKIPREGVLEIIKNAHLHIITSLIDVNPTIMWECMSYCVPTISMANNGIEDIVNDNTGFLVKLASYNKVVNEFSNTLDSIALNPSILRIKAENIAEDRRRFAWVNRVKKINKQYEIAIQNYQNGRKKEN